MSRNNNSTEMPDAQLRRILFSVKPLSEKKVEKSSTMPRSSFYGIHIIDLLIKMKKISQLFALKPCRNFSLSMKLNANMKIDIRTTVQRKRLSAKYG